MHFDNSYARLPDIFYERIAPVPVKNPRLIRLNERLAQELDLNLPNDVEELGQLFSGNSLPKGATPIAQAYAGHQFGHFVPQLGDGRALLLGERRDADGALYEIQMKGAGRTPFSRRGDGRNWYGPALREYLMSEAMHALGVPTTRSLAVVATGEPVFREAAMPGAVITRVARSHVRVGTFQYFAARQDVEALETLLTFSIERLYPEIAGSETPALDFLAAVIERQAALIARWLAIGFIHGVMNTDNMAVSGETIDYGPCAFLDEFSAGKVFSSIDHGGRYAYGQQPAAGKWNLTQLASSLLPLIDDDTDTAIEKAQAHLEVYNAHFRAHWLRNQLAKLGIGDTGTGDTGTGGVRSDGTGTDDSADADTTLVNDWLGILEHNGFDYTLAHHALERLLPSAGASGDSAEPAGKKHGGDGNSNDALLPDIAPALGDWRARWIARLGNDNEAARQRMHDANPSVIPRNHQLERALTAWIEEEDDAPYRALLDAVKQPFVSLEEAGEWARAPDVGERVLRTFCGT